MQLTENIKLHEGFSGFQYEDSLGFPTIGYGTKLPLTEEEAGMLLEHRLNKMVNEIHTALPQIENYPRKVQEAIIEMSYQMGVSGVMKFKKMIDALDNEDYVEAANEAMNSLWALQTPSRAKMVSSLIKYANKGV